MKMIKKENKTTKTRRIFVFQLRRERAVITLGSARKYKRARITSLENFALLKEEGNTIERKDEKTVGMEWL